MTKKQDFEDAAKEHQNHLTRRRQNRPAKKIKLSHESSESASPQPQPQAQEIVPESQLSAQQTITQPQQQDKKMAISYITD